jgi:hypothetical protein
LRQVSWAGVAVVVQSVDFTMDFFMTFSGEFQQHAALIINYNG